MLVVKITKVIIFIGTAWLLRLNSEPQVEQGTSLKVGLPFGTSRIENHLLSFNQSLKFFLKSFFLSVLLSIIGI